MYKLMVTSFTIGIILVLSFMAMAYKFQEKLIFYPEKLPRDFKFSFNHSFEEHFVKTQDGIELHGLLFKAKESRGLVIYQHGNAGNLENWGGVSDDIVKYGWDLFIWDYRGYGKSGGKIENEHQLYEDTKLIFDFITPKYKDKKIFIYGRSIGTALATGLAANNKVDQLILETPYVNLKKLAKELYPVLPLYFLLKYEFNNEILKVINMDDIPVWIIHGTHDEIIPTHHSHELKEKFPKSNLVIIDKGQHNNLSDFLTFHETLKRILTD